MARPHFIPSENTRKPKFADVFRGIKWKHQLLVVVNIPFKINPSLVNFPVLYPLKTQENQRFSEATNLKLWLEMG